MQADAGTADEYIAFAGRLSKEKGIDILAEAAKRLPEYRFCIAGGGPDGECLENIPNVTMMGFLTGEKLVRFMANAKVMIVPSVWYENCPLSILEALSMGVPVITVNSGGMAELVDDGKTGTLASAADVQSIVDAIEKTVGNAEYYATVKSNCATVHESILDVEAYCEILLGKYKDLIEQR